MNTRILHAAVLGTLFATTLSAQFADDFNTNTSALYTITQTPDAVATFAFDYSSLGIPPAPNTTDSTTLGLKLEANVTSAAVNGITLHTAVPFTGSYVVKFDAWVNANGPFPAGGAGSTEFLTMGVGGNSATTNVGSTGSGGWFAASGEGGSTRDYRGYKNGGEQFAESGQFNAGLSSAGGGAHNSSDPYYAQFGSIDVGALPQGALYVQQSGVSGAGSFGFAWHEVEMRVVSDGGTGGATSVSWSIDGLQIATLDAGIGSTFTTDGAVTIGYMDIFTSLSNNPALSFGLVDNLRIGTPAVATAFGAGCAGIAGVPALAAANTPELGGTLQLDATNLDPAVPIAIMVAGSSNTTSPFGPLPINLQLAGFGAGCELLVSLDALLTFSTAAGSGSFTLAIPPSIQYLGFEIFFQVGSLDSVAVGGLAVSNGIATTVGL
ncbi:MAG TPA: hypothetical protein VFZ65_01100 [Planctomycetota bacterium]|nr:hypothetical protein [Planctomycetota bacterium]